jgi:chemotaxis protein methyltransferase CheR
MTTPTADPAPAASRAAEGAPFETAQGRQEVEDLEIELLLEAIWRRYGYDLREYDRRYIRQRVQSRLQKERLDSASQLQERILRSPAALDGLLDGDEDETFESFCKPARLWKSLRRKAVPALRTYPSVRAWLVGGGSEGSLYSLLLLLHEELSRPYTLYATDFREQRIGRVCSGRLPRNRLLRLAKAFAAGGARRPLAEFLEEDDREARLRPAILNRLVLASYNPVTDASFNEFHLILARRAMHGFSDALRVRVQQLIDDSLVRFGFLVLESGETPAGRPGRYKAIDRAAGLFQKVAD